MSKASKICTSAVLTLVVTILAVGICLQEFARCDTRMGTAPFVLPFALFAVYIFPDTPWGILLLAFAQFPCYGAILGYAWVENKLERVWWRLLLYHSLPGVGCAILYSALET